MQKFIKYISYLLLGLGLILSIAFFANKDGMLDTYLGYSYILFGVAGVLAIVLPLINVVQNPKSFKKILFSIIIAAVVVGISFALAKGDALTVVLDKEPSEFTLKATDAGLILTYLLFGAAVVAIVAGGIVNLVRNR